MSNLIISPSASRDLNPDYFLEVNLVAGEKIFQEFNQKCQKLVRFPNMGRSYAQIRDDLRDLPLDGYIILYNIIDDGVEILRVVNGRQDLESLFSN